MKKIVDDHDEKDNDDETLSALLRIKGTFICSSEDAVDRWLKSSLAVRRKLSSTSMIVGLDPSAALLTYRYRRSDKM